MMTALVFERGLSRLFVFNKLAALFISEFGMTFGHNVISNLAELRWENQCHKDLLPSRA